LVSYEITDLFGMFNYSFDLDTEGITLLTGVNGTGKSTILRTIDAVSTGSWFTLVGMPFKALALGFDSGRVFQFTQDANRVEMSMTGEETYVISFSGAESKDVQKREITLMNRYRELLAREQDLERERDLVIMRPEGRDIERAITVELDHIRARVRELDIFPEWAARMPDVFPVLFITDQRLIIDTPRRYERERVERITTRVAADEVARQIAREIGTAKSVFANKTQALDRDFPHRVIRAIGRPPKVTEQELRGRLDDLTRQSKDLEAVGLLSPGSVGEFESLDLKTDQVRAVIETYTEDTQEKLDVLEPVRIKLRLFSEFLRQHYGRKRVLIDAERGFTIRVEANKPFELPPSKLSSGEQQILVLAHEVLFNAAPGTLVLIDEPELSLHVLWQASFIEDLAQMGKVNSLSFLLATHSPTLIGGREDLKRSLDVIGRED
jgi:ABC-type branched-subunit amino acid transport system ATPase component